VVWDQVSKDIVLGLVVGALVAVLFLIVGVYIVGASPCHRSSDPSVAADDGCRI
jgi:hypothetical protein